MDIADVVALTTAIEDHGVDWCICGGWGVDALLGHQMREHKDLDVFVDRDDLSAVLERLTREGYLHAYAWQENVPLDASGPCAGTDSAFVMHDNTGRMVDTHVFASEEGQVVPLWAFGRRWASEDFAAKGLINGMRVTCLSVDVQLELHQGYELPPTHREDVARLSALTSPTNEAL